MSPVTSSVAGTLLCNEMNWNGNKSRLYNTNHLLAGVAITKDKNIRWQHPGNRGHDLRGGIIFFFL
jgi:hypothetical protein